jgi:hypothetical protein
MFKGNPTKERGILHTLTSHWVDKGINNSNDLCILILLVDPPNIESIMNYLSEKHIKKSQIIHCRSSASFK